MNPSKVRAWINRRSAVITVLALTAFGATCALVYYMFRPAPVPMTYAYYYDLGTEQIFVDTREHVPPFPAPSGKTGPKGEPLAVQAHVFSCTNCDNPSERFLGYLSQYTPNAKRDIEQMIADPEHAPKYSMEDDPRNIGRVYRAPEGGDWFFANSDGADEIMSAGRKRCPSGSQPALCFPTK